MRQKNVTRARRFGRALRAGDYIEDYTEDRHTALVDLLADSMHFADRHGLQFSNALMRATDHYEAEREGVDDEP
jgi:hypothetical protein